MLLGYSLANLSYLVLALLVLKVPASVFSECHPSQKLHRTSPDRAIGSNCDHNDAATIGHSLRKAGYTAHNVAALAAIAKDRVTEPDEVVNHDSVFKLMFMAVDFWWLSTAQPRPAPSDADVLWTLVRVFALGQSVDANKLEACLGTLALKALKRCNMLARCATKPTIVSSLVSLFPVPDTWLILATDWEWDLANMTENPVMFIGRDSTALVRNMPRANGSSVLDVCAGSGVQGLTALARGAEHVVMVDINPRAVRFMHFNAALNFKETERNKITILQTDLARASLEQEFDILLANPPFVAMPEGETSEETLLYESGGRDGESVLRLVLQIAMSSLKSMGQVAIVTHLYNPEIFHDHICSDLMFMGFAGSVVYDPETVADAVDAANARRSSEALLNHYRAMGIRTFVEGLLFGWKLSSKSECRFAFKSAYEPWRNLPPNQQPKDSEDRPCAWGRDGGDTCEDMPLPNMTGENAVSFRSEL